MPARRRGAGGSGSRSATNRAPGMPAASSRASSKGTIASWVACMTRVGARTRPSRSVTSTSPAASVSRSAFSAEVDTRWSSLNQAACSGLAPGMNSVVKTCRKAGVSRPQPSRMSACRPARASRVARAAVLPAARGAPVEDEVAHTLRVLDRVGDRDPGALRDAQEREPLRARPRRPPSRDRRRRPSSEKSSTFQSDRPLPRWS